MHLSPQQNEALDKIAAWHQDGDTAFGMDPFRLFGPAGTGKTTLARQVGARLGLDPSTVQFGAYTGKAASVLRGKGCEPAGTLHSLVYKPLARMDTKRRLERAQADLAAAREMGESANDLQAELEQEVAHLEEQVNTIGWEWNPESPLADASLLILDEVSMVDAKLAADIERFEVPVLVLGDPEQLEPVGGEGYYTNSEPNYALTEIHRQALDSPVLEMATRIRTSSDARMGLTGADLTPRNLAHAMEHDQIIVWKNATRWNLINSIRAKLGRKPGVVSKGDRVMCLTNNRELGIFNGQQFDIIHANPGPLGPELLVTDDAGNERRILSHAEGFQGREQQDQAKNAYLGGRGNRGLFTFANAITCHKAQGSEWGSVYVVNEAPDLMSMTAQRKGATEGVTAARRWLYTAVTRASDSVTVTQARVR